MSAVIIGGGLSGLAAAERLASRGWQVTVVEREPELGGLARSFERDGRRYPMGYHHILSADSALWRRLEELGIAPRVRWSKHRMAFFIGGACHDLGSLRGLLAFPLDPRTKLGLLGLGLRVLRSRPGPHLDGQDARSWLEGLGGTEPSRQFLDRLVQLRFGHCTRDLSAAYLRRRVSTRELSARLGSIPGTDWAHVLVQALRHRVEGRGVRLITGCGVTSLTRDGARLVEIELEDGRRLPTRGVISTVPPEAFRAMAPDLAGALFGDIRSTAMLSLVVAVRPPVPTTHYWTNILEPREAEGVVFQLDRLNPTLPPPGTALLNFVVHGEADPAAAWWTRTEAELLEDRLAGLHAATGQRPEVLWSHLARIPHYTPLYDAGYRTPPLRSPQVENLLLAGNYTTFPEVATTGMALVSGERAADAMTRLSRADADSRGQA